MARNIRLPVLIASATVLAMTISGCTEPRLPDSDETSGDTRFISEYLQKGSTFNVMLDRETGCRYFHSNTSYTRGDITPLYGSDGQPDCTGPRR